MQSSIYNVIFRRDWKSVQKVANVHCDQGDIGYVIYSYSSRLYVFFLDHV